MEQEILKAIDIFKNGGIVIFPTDTAFGIGCRIDDEKAIQRLFKICKRPQSMATPVLVESEEMAKRYIEDVPKDVHELMEKYWPGALTIVLKGSPRSFARACALRLTSLSTFTLITVLAI